MDIKEQLGYLTARQETMQESIDKLCDTQDQILAKITFWKHAGMFLKMIGGMLLIIVTMKFGDISHVWDSFWRLK